MEIGFDGKVKSVSKNHRSGERSRSTIKRVDDLTQLPELPDDLKQMVRAVFEAIDKNGDNVVDLDEFVSFFKEAGDEEQGEKIARIIGKSDQLSCDDFERYWKIELSRGASLRDMTTLCEILLKAYQEADENNASSIIEKAQRQQNVRMSF